MILYFFSVEPCDNNPACPAWVLLFACNYCCGILIAVTNWAITVIRGATAQLIRHHQQVYFKDTLSRHQPLYYYIITLITYISYILKSHVTSTFDMYLWTTESLFRRAPTTHFQKHQDGNQKIDRRPLASGTDEVLIYHTFIPIEWS